jgi:hypothetical protein
MPTLNRPIGWRYPSRQKRKGYKMKNELHKKPYVYPIRNCLINIQRMLNKCDMATLGQMLANCLSDTDSEFTGFREQILLAMHPSLDLERQSREYTKDKLLPAISDYANYLLKNLDSE